MPNQNQPDFPYYITLLFYAANKGDEDAWDALVEEFRPLINDIATAVEQEFNFSQGELSLDLFDAGVKTLKDLKAKHAQAGFANFIEFAIRANMRYAVFKFLGM